MGDPRLNSLHLEPLRRREFRLAREVLLQARGNQTIYAEGGLESIALTSNTYLQDNRDPPAVDLNYWLVDRDCIYPLKVGVNTLGRSSENDVVVRDAFISRRHCAILVHIQSGCELHDTASKNGTYLNEKKLDRPYRLRSGDQIRICERKFTFMAKDDSLEDPEHSPTLME